MTLKQILDKNTELYKTLLLSNTRKIDEYNDANTIKLIDKNTDSINNMFSSINKNNTNYFGRIIIIFPEFITLVGT